MFRVGVHWAAAQTWGLRAYSNGGVDVFFGRRKGFQTSYRMLVASRVDLIIVLHLVPFVVILTWLALGILNSG